jgi:hypothetical protein
LLFTGEGIVCKDGGVFCREDLILVGVYLLGDAIEDDFALDWELRAELLQCRLDLCSLWRVFCVCGL